MRSDAFWDNSCGSKVYPICLHTTERLSNRIDISGSSSQTPCLLQGGPSVETALHTKRLPFQADYAVSRQNLSYWNVSTVWTVSERFSFIHSSHLISSTVSPKAPNAIHSLDHSENQRNHFSARSCRQFPYGWYLVFFLVQRSLFASAGSYPLPVQ